MLTVNGKRRTISVPRAEVGVDVLVVTADSGLLLLLLLLLLN